MSGESAPQKFLRVIDQTPLIAPNYFTVVFCRDTTRTAHIPTLKWVWFCVLEVFFGEELLESLVTTASLSGSADAPDPEGEFGWPLQLSLQVPAGFFSNLLRKHLIELLYYKFYHHYLLIEPISTIYADPTGSHWDLTRVRFRFRKRLLYQLIAFRRVYLAEALVLNLMLDSIVYAATQSFQAVVIAGFSLEALRRLMKL